MHYVPTQSIILCPAGNYLCTDEKGVMVIFTCRHGSSELYIYCIKIFIKTKSVEKKVSVQTQHTIISSFAVIYNIAFVLLNVLLNKADIWSTVCISS